jgi:aminoglycoside 6'-N-acetyltransferase
MMTAHPDTPGEWFQFAVALRATGQLIGDCAAMVRVDDPRQCEIGFTIAARYQGRSYATEAVRLLAGYLFARGKHRITACCDAECGIGRRAGTALHAARGSPAAKYLGQGRVDR